MKKIDWIFIGYILGLMILAAVAFLPMIVDIIGKL